MAEISLRDVAKYYNEKPHQDYALDFLQEQIPSGTLEKFAQLWRSGPKQHPNYVKYQITGEMLSKLTGHPADSFGTEFLDDLQELLDATGFRNDLTARRMLIAQMAHESAGFVYMKEIDSGTYLEGRKDLGNIYPNDGPKFKGCGPIQLTGRANHQNFANWMAKRGTPDENIMKLGTEYTANTYPFLCAYKWLIDNNYFNVCKTGDVYSATRRLNGGLNGIQDRIYYWERAQTCIN